MSSKNVKAIFPYLHPDYPLIIENLIFKNSKAELTVNKDIYQELFNGIDKKNMKKLIKNKKIKIYTTKIPIGLYLIVDEDYMGLGLFKTDGSFDQNRILLSENKNAIKWGEKLFKNITEQYTK